MIRPAIAVVVGFLTFLASLLLLTLVGAKLHSLSASSTANTAR
jgi:hypothetical protein